MTTIARRREPGPVLASSRFLTRVRIRNYKSVGKADVQLGPLTVLVGRNGSGKSNFLDSLRFISDALTSTLDHAIKSRGGLDAVRRHSTGHPNNFGIEVELTLPPRHAATYGFEVAARKSRGFVVKRENLRIVHRGTGEVVAEYLVEEGRVKSSVDHSPPAFPDRLYLVTASGLREFREAFDALQAMGFYSLSPSQMKELQSPDAGELLHRDGANLPSVLARLRAESPDVMRRITSYLARIVPGVEDVERVPLGPKETLEFRQKVQGAERPWRFFAVSMSDGTLRSLGALVAVTQLAGGDSHVRLVGIEEPETALHPAAAGALMDALREAASTTQIIVTTHSPDLLDQVDMASERLLVVVSRDGTTFVGDVDVASRDAIKAHLYSAGELLRMDQLEPDEADLRRQRQMRLFGDDR